MSYNENLVKIRIRNSLIYNSVIFLIFVFWYFYSSFYNIFILFLICFTILVVVFIKFIIELRSGLTLKDKILYILLFFIPIALFGNIILFNRTSISVFIPFNELVGIEHHHNILLFLLYFSIILLKLIGIKVYFSRNIKILEEGGGDEIFQFFTNKFSYQKVLFLLILFPLVAFIEELIYRTLLISVLTYYLNWNYILSIIFISIIFGLVHYSTSQNWGHVFSTLISSIIYSLALIQLGIIYPWIFHLTTNLCVLFFYYQGKKKHSI